MIPAISQVCALGSTFEDDVSECDLPGLEIWLTKLESHVAQHGLEHAAQLLENSPSKVVAASYQGGLWTLDRAARETAWEHFRHRLELCRQLHIPRLVTAVDTQREATADTAAQWQSEVLEAAKLAEEFGVELSLEFHANASIGNNLLSLAALVAPLQHPALGICWDAFHAFVGPTQTEDWDAIPIELVTHVQVCDLMQRPRELAKDRDRILPGDGDVPLTPVIQRLRAAGYQGAVSVEILNPTLGQVPFAQLTDAARGALARLLGE